jgi:hypothetical protein
MVAFLLLTLCNKFVDYVLLLEVFFDFLLHHNFLFLLVATLLPTLKQYTMRTVLLELTGFLHYILRFGLFLIFFCF